MQSKRTVKVWVSSEIQRDTEWDENAVTSVGRGCVFFRFAAAAMEFASKGEQADPPTLPKFEKYTKNYKKVKKCR